MWVAGCSPNVGLGCSPNVGSGCRMQPRAGASRGSHEGICTSVGIWQLLPSVPTSGRCSGHPWLSWGAWPGGSQPLLGGEGDGGPCTCPQEGPQLSSPWWAQHPCQLWGHHCGAPSPSPPHCVPLRGDIGQFWQRRRESGQGCRSGGVRQDVQAGCGCQVGSQPASQSQSIPGQGGAHSGGGSKPCARPAWPLACHAALDRLAPRALRGLWVWAAGERTVPAACNHQAPHGARCPAVCRTRPRGSAQHASLPPCPAAHPRHRYAGGWWARLTGGHSSPAGTAHRSPPHGAFHPLPEEPLTHPPPVPAGWCPSAAGVCRDPHVGTTVGAGNPPAQRGGPQPDGGCGPGQGLTPTAFIGSMYRAATPSLCPPHLAECWSSERPPPVPALCPPASG